MAVGQSFDSWNSGRSFGSPGNFGSSSAGSSWTVVTPLPGRRQSPAPAAVVAPPPPPTPKKSYSVDSGGVKTFYDLGKDELLDIADPWRSQRGQYQTALSDLIKNPDQFANSALFKSATNAGIEAVNRNAASRGMLKSGNRLQALMDYGQQQAPQTFFRMADLLTQLSGGRNQTPGAGLGFASQLLGNSANQQQADTSRFSAESMADLGRYNAETARMGNAQQAQSAQAQNDLLQSKWQAEQQANKRNADMQNLQMQRQPSAFDLQFQQLIDRNAQEEAQQKARRDYYDQYGGFAP